MEEQWKPIPGWEGLYEASDQGNIKSFRNGIERNLTLTSDNGYLRVGLCRKGFVKHLRVHRLVAESFLPNPENKPCINHKDGNKLNNHISNLEWCTHKENMRHAFKTGLKKSLRGSKCYFSKLNENKVSVIKIMIYDGYSNRQIAKKMKVNRSTISRIRSNKAWIHVK